MKHRIITSIFCATLEITAFAQTEAPDSIKTQNLDEVVVEAQLQRTGAQKSTYIPTAKQKKASQSGADGNTTTQSDAWEQYRNKFG